MTGHDDGFALAVQVFNQFPYLGYAGGIKTIGGFIKLRDVGISQQTGGDGQPLFHPQRIGIEF